ncbi:hypothetical protein F5X68DRAFT_192133 [Plectosphaerella plurivora]|uniref:Uncharacterized protein n=1 Tax=Plectosphaerella plurivora TaxID=936078 RepID=A0A9P8V909_9PEZI|nr:hypothetical protein F5X68DRAFT_192133 [Plectosphaerella plurivora]
MSARILASILLASSVTWAGRLQSQTVQLAERQLCGTCPLGRNPLVTLVRGLAGQEQQTTDDCRHDTVIDIPESAGGGRDGLGAVRVNFEDDENLCSVEGLSLDGNDQTRCVEGSCTISEVTDTSALVTWGACIIPPTNPKTGGEGLTDADCLAASGQIRFARNHGSTRCDGSQVVSQTIEGGDFNANGFRVSIQRFIGGQVTRCSTLHA